MNKLDLLEMERLGIIKRLQRQPDPYLYWINATYPENQVFDEELDEYYLTDDFRKRYSKLENSWTTGRFVNAVNMNKKIRYATKASDRKKYVLYTQVLLSFFLEHKELQAMMKRNDLTLKKRLADYCTVIEMLEEEEDEKVFADIVRN